MDKRPQTAVLDDIEIAVQDLARLLEVTDDLAQCLGAKANQLLAVNRAQVRLVEQLDELAREAHKAAK